MATKKTETPIPETSDTIRSLNIYQKLSYVRLEFLGAGSAKSGVNTHAEFTYFELVDIVPQAEILFAKYGLILLNTFRQGEAVGIVINADDPTQTVEFCIPLQLIAEPAKFRMNETQGVGAAVTYYRRYIYMVVLDLVEADGIDALKPRGKGDDDEAPAPAPKKASKPVTPEERKEIKEELTDSEAQASDDQKETLKAVLKKLLEMDPEQEEFVQEIAVRTNSFEDIKATACDALIENVADMLGAYTEEE